MIIFWAVTTNFSVLVLREENIRYEINSGRLTIVDTLRLLVDLQNEPKQDERVKEREQRAYSECSTKGECALPHAQPYHVYQLIPSSVSYAL